MAKLYNIAQYINTVLAANVFNTSSFKGGKFHAIASLVPEQIGDEQIARPCVIDNDGECTSVVIDDTYKFQVYHRIISLSNSLSEPDMYGDATTFIKQTAQMSLVFISDTNKIQLRGEELTAVIAANLPPTIPQAQLTALSLYSVAIYPQGEVQIDSEIVYNREYRKNQFLLQLSTIMHSISYVIETVYSKECFKACED